MLRQQRACPDGHLADVGPPLPASHAGRMISLDVVGGTSTEDQRCVGVERAHAQQPRGAQAAAFRRTAIDVESERRRVRCPLQHDTSMMPPTIHQDATAVEFFEGGNTNVIFFVSNS